MIVKSDNEEKGNVMFTELFGYELARPVYATFDPARGTITVASPQVMFGMKIGETVYTIGFANGVVSGGNLSATADPAIFAVPEVGKIENTGYFGMYAFNSEGQGAGWLDAYYSYAAEKTAVAGSSVKPANARAITLIRDAKVVK